MTKEIKTEEEFFEVASKLYENKDKSVLYEKYDEEAVALARTLFLRISAELKDEVLQETMSELLDEGYALSMENLEKWLSGDLKQGDANLRGSIVACLINTSTPTEFLELREMYRSNHTASFIKYDELYHAYEDALEELPDNSPLAVPISLMKDTLGQICQANAAHEAHLRHLYSIYDAKLDVLQGKTENALASMGGHNVTKH